MKNKILFLLLILLFAASFSFAQGRGKISGRLANTEQAAKTFQKGSIVENEFIDVIFYPAGKNSANIDVSFFESRNIEYIKSRRYITAKIPKNTVALLGGISGVEYIDIAYSAQALETVSEGRNSINATPFAYDNISGQGVKIAVIDVGFNNFDKLQASGELPKNMVTKDFTRVGAPALNPLLESNVHGAGCAEIVYDIAPKADIILMKVSTLSTLENALDFCVSTGVKIVSASIGWSTGQNFIDGTGDADLLIQEATDNGVLCVFAAGNEGDHSWIGDFVDGGDGWMIFPSGNDYLDVDLSYAYAYLEWDDYVSRSSKYTLYVYDRNSGSLIGSSIYFPGDEPCVSVLSYFSTATSLRLKIKKDSGPNLAVRLYFPYGSYANPSELTAESSLSRPGDSRDALTVGAVNFGNWANGPIEAFSSNGPTRESRANPLTYPKTIKPDIVGPDGVSTVSYGTRAFPGTSASTPHVAAAAALLLSTDNTLSARTLKDKVISMARPISSLSRPNNVYGNGKLVLDTSIIPENNIGSIVCFPNPTSISKKGYMKFTNLPFNTALIDAYIYTVAGEFVRSFDADDLKEMNGRVTIEWDLKNQSGDKVAPGVYFMIINNPVSGKTVKKIAVQK